MRTVTYNSYQDSWFPQEFPQAFRWIWLSGSLRGIQIVVGQSLCLNQVIVRFMELDCFIWLEQKTK